MKKIICLILCFSMVLCLIPRVYAKENYVSVRINAGNGVLEEDAIIQDDDLYLSAAFYSEITRFTYREDDLMYLIDGQEQEKAFKSVKINTKNDSLLISSVKEIDLPDIIDVDGELYLPLSIMLPVLNADVVVILDGVIYIANNELSLCEVLYDFEITDYTFDYASEFADNAWLGKLFYELPNFLLDSVTHWRWDRLDIVFNTGAYKDYVNIFTEYLSDDEVYLQALATDEAGASDWLNIIGTTKNLNEGFKTAFEWGEKFEDLFGTTTEYFDYLEAIMPYPHDLESLVGVANTGPISFMDIIDIIEYYHVFHYQIQDHRSMLNAVYLLDDDFVWNDPGRRAAKYVYNLYGNNVADGVLRSCWEKLCEGAFDIATSSVKIYELTSKITGVALNAVLPHNAMENAADISRLSLYESAMQSAWSNYYKYKNTLNTDDDVNNLRHAILMTLISSRSCYDVMLNVAKGYQDSLLATDYGSLISYYERQINRINAMICLLYRVADNVQFDSFEHYEEIASAIKNKVMESAIINKDDNYSYPEATKGEKEDVVIENLMPHLELLNSYYLEIYGAEVDQTNGYYVPVYADEDAIANGEPPVAAIVDDQIDTYIANGYTVSFTATLQPIINFESEYQWYEFLKEYLSPAIVLEWKDYAVDDIVEVDGELYLYRGGRGYGSSSLKLETAEIISVGENECSVKVDLYYFDRYESTVKVDFERVNNKWIICDYMDASGILSATLSDVMMGKEIMRTGDVEINGVACQVFKFGENNEQTFVTLEHFAVSPDGEIYVLDIISNEWIPYEDYDPYWMD